MSERIVGLVLSGVYIIFLQNLECILCDTIAEDTEQTQLPTRMEAELTKTILSYSKQQIKTRQRVHL